MDRLFSPWRYNYVSKASEAETCLFCDKSAAGKDEENLVVYRGEHNYVLLNLYPYTNGHVMIAPYQHMATLEEAPAGTLCEMILLAGRTEARLRSLYRAGGLNLGMNIGECAGAGVAGHIHLHMLPRWPADASFITTVGETRVIPEDLRTTWRRLREAF